jgi:beta-glucosidase
MPTRDGEVVVTVHVANVGDRAGDEVVQLYVRDEEASVARPVLELRGFLRVTLAPGEKRPVSFRLSSEQFAYVGADYRRVIEPGLIRIFVGASAVDLPLAAEVTLVGPTVHLVDRQRFFTETTLG